MRDWIRTLRLVHEVRRANRRALLRYARYGPGAGLDPEEIREIYARAGETLVNAVLGDTRNRVP